VRMDRVEFAPMRPLDDFVLQSARFQLPNFKEPARWANRVTNNLLYYQTNYFFTALVVFLIVGFVLLLFLVKIYITAAIPNCFRSD